jgi:hypothetical protein
LSRDAHFLLGLENAGVDFVAAGANRLTKGIMAIIAEDEARRDFRENQGGAAGSEEAWPKAWEFSWRNAGCTHAQAGLPRRYGLVLMPRPLIWPHHQRPSGGRENESDSHCGGLERGGHSNRSSRGVVVRAGRADPGAARSLSRRSGGRRK